MCARFALFREDNRFKGVYPAFKAGQGPVDVLNEGCFLDLCGASAGASKNPGHRHHCEGENRQRDHTEDGDESDEVCVHWDEGGWSGVCGGIRTLWLSFCLGCLKRSLQFFEFAFHVVVSLKLAELVFEGRLPAEVYQVGVRFHSVYPVFKLFEACEST